MEVLKKSQKSLHPIERVCSSKLSNAIENHFLSTPSWKTCKANKINLLVIWMSLNRLQCGSYSHKYDKSAGTEDIYKRFGTQTLLHEWPVTFSLICVSFLLFLHYSVLFFHYIALLLHYFCVILRYFTVVFALFCVPFALFCVSFCIIFRCFSVTFALCWVCVTLL